MSDIYQQLGIVRWVSHKVLDPARCNLMVIGDKPLDEREGQLLSAMIRSLNLDDVHITDSRDQIDAMKPALLLVLGDNTARDLLNTDAAMESLRGKLHSYGENKTPLIVTYHPGYLLQNPADKKKAFLDLKFIIANLV